MTTGTFPSYHGIVNNSWLDGNSCLSSCVQDNDLKNAGVFNPKNGQIYNLDETSETISFYYKTGVSPRNYKVDNLTDQLMQFSSREKPSKVIAIASRQEPAILMAGRLGKAFWQDGVTGLFTSSRYYFTGELPLWLKQFNEKHSPPVNFVWKSAYPLKSKAYHFSAVREDPCIEIFPRVFHERQTLLESTIESEVPIFGFQPYLTSPLGIETFYDFANRVIDQELEDNPNERLILWVSHSAFDTIAGVLGPQTQDAIDVGYQLDKGIRKVIDHTFKKVDPKDCLFLFYSNEFSNSITPEILASDGLDLSSKTIANNAQGPNLVDQLNGELGCSYIQAIIPPFVYFNKERFDTLIFKEKMILLERVKNLLRGVPGIKDAWSFNEIVSWPFEREDQGRFLKLQAFRNNPKNEPIQERRSGEILFQALSFNYTTSKLKRDSKSIEGGDDASIYKPNSCASLYIYQPGKTEKKEILDPIMIQQIAISLAEILQVPRPSAASTDLGPLPQ